MWRVTVAAVVQKATVPSNRAERRLVAFRAQSTNGQAYVRQDVARVSK